MGYDRYIIDKDGSHVLCDDPLEWGAWMSANSRKVAQSTIGQVVISTVFLGWDHGFGGQPMLYETMVFNKDSFEAIQERYATRDEAIKGHAEVLETVLERLGPEARLKFLLEGV